MIKVVTSVTVFNDAVGMRFSVTYSEIDEQAGTIISDNNRIDRVVTDTQAKADANVVLEYAQTFLDE